MAKVDARCPFCEQTAAVKSMVWEVQATNVIVVRRVVVVFNLIMRIAPASPE